MTGPAGLANSCVLVVDDHEISRRFTVRALRETVHTVKQARNGAEAIEAAVEFRPGLVFMDLHLPDMHGLDAIAAIRSAWPAGTPPPDFIVLTADNGAETLQRLGKVAIRSVLPKPVRRRQLRKAAAGRYGPPARPGLRGVSEPTLGNLLEEELQRDLAELDRQVMRLDWQRATAIAHRLTATAAMHERLRLEAALREFQRACSEVGSADCTAGDAAAAYCAVLEAAAIG